MDPVTHGVVGALIGKGFFAHRGGRLATFAATLGAIFPDVDIPAGILANKELAILEWHRSVTHSILCLPAFAAALGALTRWYTKQR